MFRFKNMWYRIFPHATKNQPKTQNDVSALSPSNAHSHQTLVLASFLCFSSLPLYPFCFSFSPSIPSLSYNFIYLFLLQVICVFTTCNTHYFHHGWRSRCWHGCCPETPHVRRWVCFLFLTFFFLLFSRLCLCWFIGFLCFCWFFYA